MKVRLTRGAGSRGARRRGSIGVSFGGGRIHLVQFGSEKDGVRLRGHASGVSVNEQDRKSFQKLVAELRKAHGLHGRHVVAAMPADELRLMVLNYKREANQKEDAIILGRVEERLGESARDWVIDYLPIRTSGEMHGEKSALVAAARRDEVVAYLERLRAAGLVVDALEIAPVAVRRLVSWLCREDENPLIVHCEGGRTSLIALWGRRLVLYREIDFGEQHLVESLEKSLEMTSEAATAALRDYGIAAALTPGRALDDPAQTLEISEAIREILMPSFNALGEQVRKAIAYTSSVSRGASVDRVLLLGAPTLWPGADELLQRLLNVPVEKLRPAEQLAGNDAEARAPDDSESGVAIAAGLALRGLWEDEDDE